MALFSELIDLTTAEQLLADFQRATGFWVSLVDQQGEILVQGADPSFCSRFHPAQASSPGPGGAISQTLCGPNLRAAGELVPGHASYTCPHGLLHVVTPLVVADEHVATLCLGPLLLEPPDEQAFAARAREQGFEAEQYLAALPQVPVVSREQVEAALSFLVRLVQSLAQLGQTVQRQAAALRESRPLAAVGKGAVRAADELSNVLQGVLGRADLLRFRLKGQPAPLQQLDLLAESAMRGVELLRQLLEAPAEEEPPSEPEPHSALPAGPRTVLLAEDDDLVRDMTEQLLEDAGYKVLVAANGPEAMSTFEGHQQQVDLLVLDALMPGCTGREVYDHVRKLKPDVPVLFCSGASEAMLEGMHGFNLAGGRLLQKPYTPERLLDAVGLMIDKK